MKTSLTYYWIFLITFVVVKTIYDFRNPLNYEKSSVAMMILFSLFFFSYMLIVNIKYTESEFICGSKNISLGFFSTLFPFIFIFMIGVVCIIVFPGWLRGFSNTFGLSIIRWCRYNDTLDKLMSIKPDNNNDDIINNIYNDFDVIINELEYPGHSELSNWDSFNTVFKGKMSQSVDATTLNEIKKEILGFMTIKDNIATYLWLALFSSITILVSQNRILSETCSSDIASDEKYQEYIATQLKE